MDAGVPIKSPVAGIAMGLVKEGDSCAGPHRHRGRGGPLRRHGLQGRRHRRRHHRAADGHQDRGRDAASSWPRRSSRRAQGRLHILGPDGGGAGRSRAPTSATYAPRILTIRVPVDKIRDIIGPGGKMIRSIVERTGCKIDVEDDGSVAIASTDEAAARKAIADHRGAHRHPGAGQDLPGQGRARRRLRRLRRDPARHRRPAAHLRDGAPPRQRRPQRGQARATRSWSRSSTSTPPARSGCRARRCSTRPRGAPAEWRWRRLWRWATVDASRRAGTRRRSRTGDRDRDRRRRSGTRRPRRDPAAAVVVAARRRPARPGRGLRR